MTKKVEEKPAAESAEIFSIFTRGKISAADLKPGKRRRGPKVDIYSVRLLERMLEAARQGELKSVCVVGTGHDLGPAWAMSRNNQDLREDACLIQSIDLLKFQIQNNIREDLGLVPTFSDDEDGMSS